VPGIAITTDIIAGFPTETEEDYQATVRALKEIEYDGIFAFRYSPRPGTGAASMEGDVPEDVKLDRLQKLLDLQDSITIRKNAPFEGTVQEVLVEGASETDPMRLAGRTRTNKIVNFTGAAEEGALINVEILKAHKHSLEGRVA